MQIPKPSEADKEHFRSVLPDNPEVIVKPMFGNLGAFVNGNMFAGLFGPAIGVKLSPEDKAELEATERTRPFGPEERPMGDYVGLPEVWNAEGEGDEARARFWVAKAFEYVAQLPPKAAKK
ncbi:TfoX/Sxy family protein [Arthrobacter sp. M4]|uniref:TfoX/Sxy family protein n=1 Tax=Arthrobacter sp. M4 TaxID=218160 RepID=UPI001CDBCF8D|nr:TfoX/Sxy family protein [Arthrobacter sp. M4]MCA4134003.1 TfoX/Sxy family protein [Arthrobacter sp. M4]